MLNNVVLGNYIPLDSKIHNYHPFTKIFCTFFIILSIVISNSFILTLIYTVLIGFIVFLSKISFKIYIQSFIKMKVFLLSLLIINIVFSRSIFSGIFIIWKMLLILISSSLLLYTTSSSEMVYGLKMFVTPLKIIGISPNKLAFSLSLALRFIPILLEQASKIWKSQVSRGLDFENLKLKEKIKSLKSILLPIFIISLKKSDILAETMEIRQFSFSSPRSHYKKRKLKKEEKIITIIMLIQFLIVLSLEVLL